MRKLFIGLLLLAACKTTTTVAPTSGPTPATAPSGARPALDEFLAAIRAKDLQALGGAWGDNTGAIHLYEKMGFRLRRRLSLLVLALA